MSLFNSQYGYQRLDRNSFDAEAAHQLPSKPLHASLDYRPTRYCAVISWYPRQLLSACSNVYSPQSGRRCSRGTILRRILAITLISFIALLAIAPFLNPYSKRPPHYTGSNPSNETVFIAANIVDEGLVRGRWGEAILELIEKIGPDNTFLSIYENDSGPGTKAALRELAEKVPCEYSIVSGHIDLDDMPTVEVIPGEHRIKQMAYLAHVRNQALKPLDQPTHDHESEFNSTSRVFDKLFFVNDVVFSPSDAADLLFATNIGPDNRTNYHAACAMDFGNAFKFYDRFALRDAEYYRVGLPFFPWFTKHGESKSWSDVIRGTDAVRVQSCWGGMVAFEAKWFQSQNQNVADDTPALRFQYEPDLFWDASECCLIHANLAYRANGELTSDPGIYVNPFIRVAYDATTFSWLEFVRRFERLFTFGHTVADAVRGFPNWCARRLDSPGELVTHRKWVFDDAAVDNTTINAEDGLTTEIVADFGHWETVTQTAMPGGYCGYPMLLLLRKDRKPGENMREKIEGPFDSGAEGP